MDTFTRLRSLMLYTARYTLFNVAEVAIRIVCEAFDRAVVEN